MANRLNIMQCSVTGSGVFVLRWRILRDDGTQFGAESIISTSNEEPDPIGGVFTPERLSPLPESPLVSNMSFIAQSSINGFTIVCDGTASGNKNVTITQVHL